MNNQDYPKFPPGVGGQNDKKKKKKDPSKLNQKYQGQQRNRTGEESQNDRVNYGDQILNSLMQNDIFNQQFLGNYGDHHQNYPTQEIQFVNDIEQVVLSQTNNQVNNLPEPEESQKTKYFLSELNSYLEKKGDILIEIGKKKIDWMETFIENKIQEKICCKIQEQVYDKDKLVFKEEFEDQLLNKQYLKKQVIFCLQEGFREYFQEVAKVFDLGLKHFVEYCKESEQISKINNEKCKQIFNEIESLQEGDTNIISKLQEQTKEEQEELNNMKEINEAISRYNQSIILLKDKNNQLETYLQSLYLKIHERIRYNKKQIDGMVQNVLQEVQKAIFKQQQKQQQQQNNNNNANEDDSDDEESADDSFQQQQIKPIMQIAGKQLTKESQQNKQIDAFFQDEDEDENKEDDDDEEEENVQDQEDKQGGKEEQKQFQSQKINRNQQKKCQYQLNDGYEQRNNGDINTKNVRNQYRQNYTNNIVFNNSQVENSEENLNNSG